MNRVPDRTDTVGVSRRHLELCTATVVAALLSMLDDVMSRGLFDRDDVERRFPFLTDAAEELSALASGADSEDPETFRRLAAQLAEEAAQPPPLARLAAFGGFVPSESSLAVDLMATAALVERDVRFGAVIATLQAPATTRWPCLGLLAVLFGRNADEVARLVGVMVDAGFLTIDDPGEPRAERTVRIPAALLEAIEGSVPLNVDLTPVDEAPDFDDLVLPHALVERIGRAASLIEQDELDALILRGAGGTGRHTVLRAVAGRLGRGLLVTSSQDDAALGAIAVLTGAMLAWSVEPALGQLATVRRPPGAGAVGVITGTRGAVRIAGGKRVVVLDLPTPDASARRRFWTRSGLRAGDEVLNVISHRYVLSGGTIVRVAGHAAAIARLDDRDTVAVDDVRQAAQDQGRQRLESLARLLSPVPAGFAPVLSGTTAEAYAALALRSRHRERLPGAVGGPAGAEVNRGVRALLSGPSGTGKTLAARALGSALHLDVYRADLAALVDKYIGETERRLDALFTCAEELDVVLLIDEGDALMTRRTEVHSSNDRYANLETDYLLQRLETYEGIVLITTNSPQLVDTAFQRRLDATITFSPPGAADRSEIWRRHLPQRHAVHPDTVERLATSCRMTGGQIRNAAVHAALLALDADRLVDDDAIVTAVEREYVLSGQTSPLVRTPAPVSPFEQALARP